MGGKLTSKVLEAMCMLSMMLMDSACQPYSAHGKGQCGYVFLAKDGVSAVSQQTLVSRRVTHF
jgi:hypothetical protein